MAGGVLVSGVPVAAWGLMGQDDAQVLQQSQLDHDYRPLTLPVGLETALGIGALLLAGAGAVLLVRAQRRGAFDRRWWQVLAPLVAAGLIVGAGWRVVNAGGTPDNIGAGLVVLFGGPFVVALALWALGRGVSLALQRDARRPEPRATQGSLS